MIEALIFILVLFLIFYLSKNKEFFKKKKKHKKHKSKSKSKKHKSKSKRKKHKSKDDNQEQKNSNNINNVIENLTEEQVQHFMKITGADRFFCLNWLSSQLGEVVKEDFKVCKGVGKKLKRCRKKRKKKNIKKREKIERDNEIITKYIKKFIDDYFVDKRYVIVEFKKEKLINNIKKDLQFGVNSLLYDRIDIVNDIPFIKPYLERGSGIENLFSEFDIRDGDILLSINDVKLYGEKISSKEELDKILKKNNIDLLDTSLLRFEVKSRPNYNILNADDSRDVVNFMFSASKDINGNIIDDGKYTHIHTHIHK